MNSVLLVRKTGEPLEIRTTPAGITDLIRKAAHLTHRDVIAWQPQPDRGSQKAGKRPASLVREWLHLLWRNVLDQPSGVADRGRNLSTFS